MRVSNVRGLLRVALGVALMAGQIAVPRAHRQAPLDDAARALRAHQALLALDRYLETWNSRDPRRWAASLHFPHVRPGPGAFELSQTPEEYAANVDFARTLASGWHHSEWSERRVLQVGLDKVHVAGRWTRYTAEGKPLTGSVITYVVTNQNGRWGVLSRFAAGVTLEDEAMGARNTAAARVALKAYESAWNGGTPEALAATLHFPHVRIADGAVELWKSADDFLAGPEPGRQRTWYRTRSSEIQAVQASANGVNFTLTIQRLGRSGEVITSAAAVALVVQREGAWKVQALSTMGT